MVELLRSYSVCSVLGITIKRSFMSIDVFNNIMCHVIVSGSQGNAAIDIEDSATGKYAMLNQHYN